MKMEKQARILKHTIEMLQLSKQDAELFLCRKTSYPLVNDNNEFQILNIINLEKKERETGLRQGVLF